MFKIYFLINYQGVSAEMVPVIVAVFRGRPSGTAAQRVHAGIHCETMISSYRYLKSCEVKA